ncbi:jg1586, partial [Pararge aegeria aegeria]
VRLKNSRVTLDGIRYLLEHKPYDIELVKCEYLSQAWLELISHNSENLVSLKFGPLKYVVSQKEILLRQRCFVISAPNLRRLTIQCRGSGISPILLSRPLRHLTHLDLSDFTTAGSTWAIYELKNLRSLVLHSVLWSMEIVEWISGLRLLRHLDISQANERLGKYSNPNQVLAKLVTNLTELEYLDISGTNLAGTGSIVVGHIEPGSSDQEAANVRCDIPGLITRVNRPLEFLGLYGTHHGACKRHDIPAKVVS